MPNQVMNYNDKTKGLGLGAVLTIAGATSLFVAPIIGLLSDRTTLRMVLRKIRNTYFDREEEEFGLLLE